MPAALVLLALGGCALKHPTANLVNGKQLFVAQVRRPATRSPTRRTSGTVGPNLDDAFRQDRADGVKSTSIQGLVDYWIQYPNSQGVMPAMLLKGQDAQDVAAYVARVAAMPGQDTGALATAVAAVKQKPAIEKNGMLQIDADPTGQLKFLASSATATAGHGDDQDAEQVLGTARHRDHGATASTRSARVVIQRRHRRRSPRPLQARHVHVLLLGRRPRAPPA